MLWWVLQGAWCRCRIYICEETWQTGRERCGHSYVLFCILLSGHTAVYHNRLQGHDVAADGVSSLCRYGSSRWTVQYHGGLPEGSSQEISVFDYSQVIFAAILGFVFLDQIPDVLSIIGYIIIIGSAVGKWWYTMKKNG